MHSASWKMENPDIEGIVMELKSYIVMLELALDQKDRIIKQLEQKCALIEDAVFSTPFRKRNVATIEIKKWEKYHRDKNNIAHELSLRYGIPKECISWASVKRLSDLEIATDLQGAA